MNVQLDGEDAYSAELRYFLDCVSSDRPVEISTGHQATESLRIVLAEIESARTGRTVTLNP